MNHAKLLLLGGGHAHLFVLEALEQRATVDEIILVTPNPGQTYSGMVPGMVAGRYSVPEIVINLQRLAQRASVRIIYGVVTALDAEARSVTLGDGQQVSFDICSIAVGSMPTGLGLPGVAVRALVAKPIDSALAIVPALEEAAQTRSPSVVVVGGGAAGVELALAARARLVALRVPRPDVTLVTAAAHLVEDRHHWLGVRASIACRKLGVAVRRRATVTGVDSAGVHLADGAHVPADLLIWSAGAAAPDWFRRSGLACDNAGFIVVDSHLQSVSHPHIFVAGDAATLRDHPRTPKSGVMAVREGPILADNLADRMHDRPVRRRFIPQKQTLALLATGDGRALLSYGSLVTEGRMEMWLKDLIDRRFMRRFARPD